MTRAETAVWGSFFLTSELDVIKFESIPVCLPLYSKNAHAASLVTYTRYIYAVLSLVPNMVVLYPAT